MINTNLSQSDSGVVAYPRISAREDWRPDFAGFIAVIVFDGKKGMYLGKVAHDDHASLELVSWRHLRKLTVNRDWLQFVNELIVVHQEVDLTPSQCRSKLRLVEGLFKAAKTCWFRMQIVRIRRSKLSGVQQTSRHLQMAFRRRSEEAVREVQRLCRKAERSGTVENLVI